MPTVKVIAKRDLIPVFKKGDKLTIEPILYEEDTQLTKPVYGIVKDSKIVGIYSLDYKLKEGEDIKLIFDAVFAKKGSYKDSRIITEDGIAYPSSLVRNYKDFFTKV